MKFYLRLNLGGLYWQRQLGLVRRELVSTEEAFWLPSPTTLQGRLARHLPPAQFGLDIKEKKCLFPISRPSKKNPPRLNKFFF